MKKEENKELENYMEGLEQLDHSELITINGGDWYLVWDPVAKKMYFVIRK